MKSYLKVKIGFQQHDAERHAGTCRNVDAPLEFQRVADLQP